MKQNKKKNKAKQVVSVAVLLSLQVFPHVAHAQPPVTQRSEILKQKDIVGQKLERSRLMEQKMTLVAVLNGEPVFKNGKGELFTMDASTGDIKNVVIQDYEKIGYGAKAGGNYVINKATIKNSLKNVAKPITIKWKVGVDGIRILGTDIDGHLIQETARGEKFYLDPETGDMIDWVQHIFILK